MQTKHQDEHLHFRKVRIDFLNPPHLEDCLAHCREWKIEDRFEAMLGVLRGFAIGEALKGDETWIRLIPTSRTQPTFRWSINVGSVLIASGHIQYSTIAQKWSIEFGPS